MLDGQKIFATIARVGAMKTLNQSFIKIKRIMLKCSVVLARLVSRIRRYAPGFLIFFISEVSLEGAPNWTLEKLREQGIVEKCQKAQELQNEKLFVKAGKIMDEIHSQLSESQFDGGGVRYTFELLTELDGRWRPTINGSGLRLRRESKGACENKKTHQECVGEYVFSYYGSGADAEALEQAAHDGNFLEGVSITRVMQLSNHCKIEPSTAFVNAVSLYRFKVSDQKIQKKSLNQNP